MARDEKKPAIRFAGYTDPWEQRKLGDLMNVGSVKRIHQSDWTSSGIRFLRARDLVSAAKNEEPTDYLYISEEKYREYSALSGKVQKGDLLVTGVGTIGVPFLIVDDTEIYFKDGNIIWFKNGEMLDGAFFYYSFISEKIQSFIKESAGIGTVGTYTIDSGKKTPIMLPDVREQRQLGLFFSHFDNLITLHQRKCDKLISVKKSMLEKMFPQNGSNVPGIRFAGFTDPWEQRKLEEYCKITTGKLDANAMVTNGQYDFYTSGIAKYKIDTPAFEGPAITIAGNGATVGHMYLADGLFNAYQRTYVLTNFLAEREYLFYEIRGKLPLKIKQEARTGNIPYIVLDMLSDLEISIPSHREQVKIATYLHAVDNLITLHQRKLEKLRNIKKSLLEKMFV